MEDLAKIFIGSTTVAAVLIWLGKVIINKGFDAALETFKNKLALLKIEHEIKYSKLHEERATILKQMFEDLYQLEVDLRHLTSHSQGPEWTEDNTRYDKAYEQLQKSVRQLETSRIYFTSDFCDSLEDSLKNGHSIIQGMMEARDDAKSQKESYQYGDPIKFEEGEKPLQKWRKQRDRVESEIKERRLELAEIFRELIGVEKEKN
jgi:hypothetical protein